MSYPYDLSQPYAQRHVPSRTTDRSVTAECHCSEVERRVASECLQIAEQMIESCRLMGEATGCAELIRNAILRKFNL